MLKKLSVTAVLVIGFLSFSAETISAQQMTDAANVSRSKMERQIRKEILTLPYYGVFDAIGYSANGDTITLEGYVVRPTTKSDAEAAVKDVEGVKNVVNNIKVLPLSSLDDQIRVRIYNALSNTGSLYRYLLGTNPAIRIIVDNGNVSLEGIVGNEGDKNLAGIAAREIFGVFGVKNNLQVEKREGEKIG